MYFILLWNVHKEIVVAPLYTSQPPLYQPHHTNYHHAATRVGTTNSPNQCRLTTPSLAYSTYDFANSALHIKQPCPLHFTGNKQISHYQKYVRFDSLMYLLAYSTQNHGKLILNGVWKQTLEIPMARRRLIKIDGSRTVSRRRQIKRKKFCAAKEILYGKQLPCKLLTSHCYPRKVTPFWTDFDNDSKLSLLIHAWTIYQFTRTPMTISSASFSIENFLASVYLCRGNTHPRVDINTTMNALCVLTRVLWIQSAFLGSKYQIILEIQTRLKRQTPD